MKYLSIILAFTMLGLSFVPCSDSVIAYSATHHEHEDHNESHGEGCSPFCTCDCCSIFVEAFELRLSICIEGKKQIVINNEDCTCNFTFAYSFDYNTGIWNPPRFS